jgi:hypothetical protein
LALAEEVRQLTEALRQATSWEATLRIQGALQVLEYLCSDAFNLTALRREGGVFSDIPPTESYDETDSNIGTED